MKSRKLHINITILLVALISCAGLAQQQNYTLGRDFLWGIDKYYNTPDVRTHTFIKPYLQQTIAPAIDSALKFRPLFGRSKRSSDTIKSSNFLTISASPYLDLGAGCEFGAESRATYDLGAGARIIGQLGKKFGFELRGFGQRGRYNTFTDSVIRESAVVPGIGYAYRADQDSIPGSYATQQFTGYVSWSPHPIFNVQAGNDKHFWGDGYRSLFLSDAGSPYPFLKITTNVWRLTYVNLYTIMKDVRAGNKKADWQNKYATLHYLGWNATKRIHIGIFESVVWQGSDSVRNRGYDVNYLNPVMFFRPTEYSLGSSDNAFLGLSFKVRIYRRQQLYGQILLDEFLLKEVREGKGWWANKQALQGGFKVFDLFRLNNVNFQTEINYVRPYTYSHGSVPQNYGHMNQSLAHPLGANFTESVTFLNYTTGNWFMELKFNYAVYGGDSAGTNYGKDIFLSYTTRPKDYYNYTGQGFHSTLMTASLRAAYIIHAGMNLKAELGVADRIHQTLYSTRHMPYIFVGIRTDLYNRYSDF